MNSVSERLWSWFKNDEINKADIFISYSHRNDDGIKYAENLHDRLRVNPNEPSKFYDIFIDKRSGIATKTQPVDVNEIARNSGMMVVVGNKEAFASSTIQKEINAFLEQNKNKPLKIIYPSSFENDINGAVWFEDINERTNGLIESEENFFSETSPSSEVIGDIFESFTFPTQQELLRRSEKKIRQRGTLAFIFTLTAVAAGVIAIIFAMLASKSSAEAQNANSKAVEATELANMKTREAANASTLANKESERANSETRRANEQANLANVKTEEANKATKLANIAKSEADKATAEVKRKTSENAVLTQKTNQLITQTGNLRKEAANLETQSKMLQIRIAAQNQLTQDPVVAYKLAAEAFKLAPDAANRKLILSALSKIDLFYNYRIKDYSIEDFKEPYILLSRKKDGDEGNDLLVFDMNSLRTQPLKIKADRGWIIPFDSTWRLLSMNWKGSGMDANTVYQLWDADGKALSDKIDGGKLLQIKFHNNGKASFPLYKDSKVIVWDLINNEKQIITHDSSRDSDTYFYDIYGELDTRNDGVSAAHYRDGLVLVDKTGKIDINSYTEADFDPSAFFPLPNFRPTAIILH